MGKFKYLFFLFGSLLFLLFFTLSLNYLVNPYQYFSHERIFGSKGFLSSTLLSMNSNNTIRFKMQQDIKNTKSNSLIIGSSRILQGINTCSNPELLKIGVNAIDIDDNKLFIKEGLHNKSINKIYIELILYDSGKIKKTYNKPSFWEANFSLKSLFTSIILLIHQNEDVNLPNCKFYEDSVYKFQSDEYYKKRYKIFFEEDMIDRAYNVISSIVQEIDSTKSIKLVFFIAPYNKGIGPTMILDTKRLRSKIKKIKKENISIEFINYLDYNDIFLQKAVKNNNMWYDMNHFKPIIGDYFLKLLNSN